MTYEDAMDATVTRREARMEIVRHYHTVEEKVQAWTDFVNEYGDLKEFEGSDVLAFLGY